MPRKRPIGTNAEYGKNPKGLFDTCDSFPLVGAVG
jgi:hypothetical protein